MKSYYLYCIGHNINTLDKTFSRLFAKGKFLCHKQGGRSLPGLDNGIVDKCSGTNHHQCD